MPSPVGHALGAIALGWAVAPPAQSRQSLIAQTAVLAAIGIAPDLDLLIGRHSRETHSVGATLIVAAAAAWWRWPIAASRTRIFAAALVAYLSHPLFDALSPDGSAPFGVMLWWPFSREHWQTGLFLFDSIWRDWRDPDFLRHNTLALLRELALLLPLLTGTGYWKSRIWRSEIED